MYHKHKYFQCSLSIFLTVEGVSIFLVRIYYQNNSIYFLSHYLHYTIVIVTGYFAYIHTLPQNKRASIMKSDLSDGLCLPPPP